MDGNVHLLQLVRLVPPGAGGSPARHRGHLTSVVFVLPGGEAGRTDLAVEVDRLGQGEDGVVVVQGAGVVVGVVSDGRQRLPIELVVVDLVLPHKDGDGAGGLTSSAVSSREDVLVGDESPSTPGVVSIS